MVPDPNSAQVVGTRSRQSAAVGTGSRQVRFGAGSDGRCTWYQMAELVQKGWTHLEVKGHTWRIETLVHETFSLLAQ
jgi:hypothetical protein